MKAPAGRFRLLPRRAATDKSHYGHALVVAGCDAMPGAALLAARAALLAGSGLVTLASTRRVLQAATLKAPDLLTLPMPACTGTPRGSAAFSILRYVPARRVTVAAVGPGLSTAAPTRLLVRHLVHSLPVPVVLDADGLNAFKGHAGQLRRRRSPAVLTPHEREFARLFGQSPPIAQTARARLAKRVARDYSIVLVLKGHHTVVTDGRRLYVNATGNAGMAKGGTGDVLTGMIAAFAAQGLELFDAAAWAVFLHGRAGDRLARRKSQLSVTASGLLEELPAVFKSAAR